MIDYNIRGMNKHIVEANVKLQDENKLLKEDKEILKRRIEKAINILELSAMNKGMCTQPETDTIQKTLLILKGEYIEEEK